MKVGICPACKYLDIIDETTESFCPRCSGRIVSLGVSSSEWNAMSEDEMKALVDSAVAVPKRQAEPETAGIDTGSPQNERLDTPAQEVYIKPVNIERPVNMEKPARMESQVNMERPVRMESAARMENPVHTERPVSAISRNINTGIPFPVSAILLFAYVTLNLLLGSFSAIAALIYISCIALGVTLIIKRRIPVWTALFASAAAFLVSVIFGIIHNPYYFSFDYFHDFFYYFLCGNFPTMLIPVFYIILGVLILLGDAPERGVKIALMFIPIACLALRSINTARYIRQFIMYEDSNMLKPIANNTVVISLLYVAQILMVIWIPKLLANGEEIQTAAYGAGPVIKAPAYAQNNNVNPPAAIPVSGFQRMEGFAGHIPQAFADNRIPRCPMCKTTDPHWSVSERMGKIMSFDPEENAHKYLFRCEKCGCILRVPVTDVIGTGRSALLSWQGLAKKKHGKITNAIYVTIEYAGNAQSSDMYVEKEMTLEELNALAAWI